MPRPDLVVTIRTSRSEQSTTLASFCARDPTAASARRSLLGSPHAPAARLALRKPLRMPPFAPSHEQLRPFATLSIARLRVNSKSPTGILLAWHPSNCSRQVTKHPWMPPRRPTPPHQRRHRLRFLNFVKSAG